MRELFQRVSNVPRGTGLTCSTGNETIDKQNPDPQQEYEVARRTIELGLEALQVRRDTDTLHRFARLSVILAEWAPKMNLTGHRGAEAIAQRLVLDAVALISSLPPYERLVDLGSGAGFPGLPIAVLFPDRELISVEARSKRVSFQKTVVRELGLTNVKVRLGRIEELEPAPCDGVVAQAVAAPDKVVDLMLPWCEANGWMAIPGTPASLAAPPPAAATHSEPEVRTYQVPLGGAERRVWLATKLG